MYSYEKNRYTIFYTAWVHEPMLIDADGFTVRKATEREVVEWENNALVDALGYIEIDEEYDWDDD